MWISINSTLLKDFDSRSICRGTAVSESFTGTAYRTILTHSALEGNETDQWASSLSITIGLIHRITLLITISYKHILVMSFWLRFVSLFLVHGVWVLTSAYWSSMHCKWSVNWRWTTIHSSLGWGYDFFLSFSTLVISSMVVRESSTPLLASDSIRFVSPPGVLFHLQTRAVQIRAALDSRSGSGRLWALKGCWGGARDIMKRRRRTQRPWASTGLMSGSPTQITMTQGMS